MPPLIIAAAGIARGVPAWAWAALGAAITAAWLYHAGVSHERRTEAAAESKAAVIQSEARANAEADAGRARSAADELRKSWAND